MNLQVCCPYKKCPFGCPTCIAATDYKYPYGDIYFTEKERYLELLRSTIGKYDKYILTGDTEPTLFYEWIKDVCTALEGQEIELQTKNYHVDLNRIEGLVDTLAISIPTLKDWEQYQKMAGYLFSFSGNVRLVFLETKELEVPKVFNMLVLAEQITVKKLQIPEAEEERKAVEQLKGNPVFWKFFLNMNKGLCSVRYDENCMDSAGRYEILRTDGNFYEKWF